MDYWKIDAPLNFSFGALAPRVEELGGTFRLFARDPARWPRGTGSIAGLDPARVPADGAAATLEAGPDGSIRLALNGRTLLESAVGGGLGVSGSRWMLRFKLAPDMRFFGMGEKLLGHERSGRATLFWNTDAFADFHGGQVAEAAHDPSYASLPVLIVRAAGAWVAIVLDAPYPSFMDTGAVPGIFQAGSTPFEPELLLGARGGEPCAYFIAREDPLELLRAVQLLQGACPLPPLWALGHQQCRWGYADCADLERVAAGYAARGIPDDGLWLDIDYMDGFRVFTIKGESAEPGARAAFARGVAGLAAKGHPVVPILDPGIRLDPGSAVYERAKGAGALCRNPEGGEYVGHVWPGRAVFPDFSLPEGREFWAAEVARLTAELGFGGYWIDMNDPSTGGVPLEDMLFARGELPHEAFHNQYALGMAQATREGLLRARPEERPFIVSRSAFLGMAPEAAIWTGDNCSNAAHMAQAIPTSVNLAVSGAPFNGPDVPGFAGDPSPALVRAWYKLGFLFPFLRNHSIKSGGPKEPWRFGARTERVVAGMIRARYRLMPQLYGLFADQEERGEPIMRPLWAHDPAEEAAAAGDQYLLGADIMHAPIAAERGSARALRLPEGRWYGLLEGRFLAGARGIRARQGFRSTPLYLRSPSIIALRRGPVETAATNLSRADFLVVAEEGAAAARRYVHDDGRSLRYRAGERSEHRLRARVEGGALELELDTIASGAGPLDARFLVLARAGIKSARLTVRVKGEPAGPPRPLALRRESLLLAGSRITVLATGAVATGAVASGDE